jgi:quercetin dioxygenase-like cupin family protein
MRNPRLSGLAFAFWPIALLIVVFCTAGSFGQSRSTRPRSLVAPSASFIDVTEDCCFHKLLSNDRVRVLHLKMSPHQSTAINQHLHDYVILSLGTNRLQASGAAGNDFRLDLEDGEVQIMKGGWPHKVMNLGDATLDLLELEVTRNINPEQALCGLGGKECADGRFGKTDAGTYSYSTLFETPTVKLRRIELGPGGSLSEHTHSGGELIITLSKMEVMNQSAQQASTIAAAPGEVNWIGSAFAHSLTNNGKDTARFLEFELK